jgi:hypothetical protein
VWAGDCHPRRSRSCPILEPAKEFASHQNAPNWLEIDRDNYKGKVLALPKREDINLPVNEQLIVELYSKVGRWHWSLANIKGARHECFVVGLDDNDQRRFFRSQQFEPDQPVSDA